MKVIGKDKVKCHYVGWSPSFDTVFWRKDLQLDGNPPTIIDRPPK